MLLFTGPVEVLRDAPALAWYGSARGYQEPHLVWPEDQAWCLACEVDEEVEFTVGCSVDASRALDKALPGAVRRVHYGDPAPLYRDPAYRAAPCARRTPDLGVEVGARREAATRHDVLRTGVRPDSVQVLGGTLSMRLPTINGCGSLPVCAPAGCRAEA